jgi:hypothetical protein
VRAEDVSGFQSLIGVGRAAAVGNVVAIQTDPYRTIAFAQACNEYIDHYTIDPAVLDPAVVKHRREIAEFAQSGHYQPKDIGEPKAKGRTN